MMPRMRLAFGFLAIAIAAHFSNAELSSQEPQSVTHVTVPMSVEGNAPIVTLGFKRPDGGLRIARFIFDSGGGAVILDQRLATDLGLEPEGETISSDGHEFRHIRPPMAFAGGMPVDLLTSNAFVHLGTASFDNRDRVEGLLPGKALERYQVVLDYPRQLFSIGEAASLTHRGEKLACPYVASSGHARVELTIDGVTYGFLLDTGSKVTLARADILQKWAQEHPKWSKSTGAVGLANETGELDADAFLLRIPELQVGERSVTNAVMVSRPDEIFSYTTYETPAPIIGALGGNVLSLFRVEIDYPEQLLFLDQEGRGESHDFDTVGLVLGTNSSGQLVVRAVSPSASKVTRQNVLPGDVIVGIGGSRKVPQTLTEGAQALSGSVGEHKQMRILRNGKSMTVTVIVNRIL
jgi:hypothetical protein